MTKKGNYQWTEMHRHNDSEAQKRRYLTRTHPLKGSNLPLDWCAHISEALKRYYQKNPVWNIGIHINSEETVRSHIILGLQEVSCQHSRSDINNNEL